MGGTTSRVLPNLRFPRLENNPIGDNNDDNNDDDY